MFLYIDFCTVLRGRLRKFAHRLVYCNRRPKQSLTDRVSRHVGVSTVAGVDDLLRLAFSQAPRVDVELVVLEFFLSTVTPWFGKVGCL